MQNFEKIIRNAHITENSKHQNNLFTHIFQAACGKDGTSDERAGLVGSTHPSPSSEHHKNNVHGYTKVAKNQRKRSFHKTIAVIISPCLLQLRNNQRPHSHNIGHNVQESSHATSASYHGFLQCWSGSHPIAILCPLQRVHDELRHRVGTQNAKHA